MNSQVSKWGNSLAMRIPSEIVRRFGLWDGDTVDAQLTVDGALTIRPAGRSRRAFAGELDAARCAARGQQRDGRTASGGEVLSDGLCGHQRPSLR